MSASASAAPLLDTARVVDFAALLPPGQVTTLLDAFARELETRPALFAQLAAAGDRTGLHAAAHHFKGAALSVGGERVAAIAHQLEQAEPTQTGELVAAFATCADQTLAEVRRVAAALAAERRAA